MCAVPYLIVVVMVLLWANSRVLYEVFLRVVLRVVYIIVYYH